MMNTNIEETEKIVKSIDIPSRPYTLLKINEEFNKSEPNLKTIVSLISEDLAMTAKAMRIANSPFFGLRFKVDSVDRALSVLGLNNFNNIILATSLRKAFDSYQISVKILDEFYHHYLLIGGVSKFLAQNTLSGEINHNHAFITGLFHDCGIILLVKRFPNYYENIEQNWDSKQSLLSFEENHYNTNHCLIGSNMVQAWNLPDIVWKVILYHHNPDLSIHQETDVKHMLAILILSEHLISKIPVINKPNDLYNFQIPSEELLEKLLLELKIDKYDFKCIEENIEELVNLM